MSTATIFFLLIAIIIQSECSRIRIDSPRREYLPEDGRLNFTELCTKYGESVEDHKVATEDGYILTMFHMSPAQKTNKLRPVLLLHGIVDSSDSFVIRGNKSLAMKLVKMGYDVWVANSRGNKYSRSHKKLDPDKDQEFWNFSFHDTGYYDIPAMIDYILNKTGEKKLSAIAHSQGTTEFFVLGSTRPEYNEKVNIFIALAPAAFLNHVQPPLLYMVQSASALNAIVQAVEGEEVLADHDFSKPIMEIFCTYSPFRYELCVEGFIFAMGGSDRRQFESEFLPVIIGHIPCGTSRKNLLHWAQNAQRKRFAEFDYGTGENLAKFKSVSSPNYDLAKNNMTIALFYTGNDGFSNVKDVKRLKNLLPNVVEFYKMKPKNWNHFDFVWGRYMSKYLYPRLFQVLQKYDQH